MSMLLALALQAGCSGDPSPPEARSDAPETVVVVIACTMRAGRLHAYGNPRETSPYIDALAAEGVRFVRTLTGAPWTRPGVASVVTGRYPLAIGIDHPGRDVNHNRGLHPDIATAAERFKAAGWSTAGATANPNANAVYGFAQGFDSYYESGGLWRDGFHKASGADMVDAWLESVKDVEGPLFGQLVVIDTHAPLGELRTQRAQLGLSPVGKLSMVDHYDASVLDLDATIQRLDEGLARLGRSDRLLVFTSDHGEGLNDPEWAGPAHGRWLYDANLHVPWILHGGPAAKGHVVEGLSSNVDVLPTLLELMGIAGTPELDGVSRAAEVRGARADTEAPWVYSETRYGSEQKSRLTTSEWAYVQNDRPGESGYVRGREELYADADRTQASDVIAQHPEAALALQTELRALRAEVEARAIHWDRDTDADADEAMARQLEALGYVEEAPAEAPGPDEAEAPRPSTPGGVPAGAPD